MAKEGDKRGRSKSTAWNRPRDPKFGDKKELGKNSKSSRDV
jgi:hypothetical protein